MTTETEKSPGEIARGVTDWLHEVGFIDKDHINHRRITDRVEKALRDRDERAAKICEDLVTFPPDHEKYTPADGSPCGWCDGLEAAASAIRGKSK
jgi:ribosomal protein S19E (S16A)